MKRRSAVKLAGTMAAVPDPSPLDAALSRVGDRWSLLVVDALLDGPRKFGELEAHLPGIAPNILTQRLRHLADVGVVIGREYSARPQRFEYLLTETGRELAGALRLLAHWGSGHSPTGAARHEACGTVLEPRWYCPTCDAPSVDGADLDYA